MELLEACRHTEPALLLDPAAADLAPAVFKGTCCLTDARGELAAAARVSRVTAVRHEVRDAVSLWVHPDHRRRGCGARLLAWAEATSREWATPAQGMPHVLRVDRSTTSIEPNPEVEAWLARGGLTFRLAECELGLALEALPPLTALPEGLQPVTWSEETAGLFFATYSSAFRDRPGFPGWPESVWRQAFTGSPEFRPDLSVALLDRGGGGAFLLCEVTEDGPVSTRTGWITQMGVSPSHRRRGLGSWLLGTALRALRDRGIRQAALDVNLNNPGALALYKQLGFRVSNCRRVYQKLLAS
jgi:GNAT superfamily N-acetyltransferase